MDTLKNSIGCWVQVSLAGATSYMGVGRRLEYGILDAADEAWLYLRVPDGSTLCLPRSQITGFEVIQPPPSGPAGELLRPAEPPADTERLLRPVTVSSDSDPDTLLRSADFDTTSETDD